MLVGHSFGTVLGLLMTWKAAPQIDAYVGASQVVNWARQELTSYRWALAEATASAIKRRQRPFQPSALRSGVHIPVGRRPWKSNGDGSARWAALRVIPVS